MKLPAFQFYPGDWRKDPGIQSLDYETRGIWFEMLCLMHESEQRGKLILNGSKFPDDGLARVLGVDLAKLQQTLSKLLASGVASVEQDSGVIFNRRMLRDEDLRQVRSKSGQLGGKQKSSNILANAVAKPTPSVSVSVSSSVSTAKKKKDKTHSTYDAKFEDFWSAYPQRSGNPKTSSYRAWQRACERSCDPDQLTKAAANFKKHCEVEKVEGKFIPHASTWLNQDRYLDYLNWVEPEKPKPSWMTFGEPSEDSQ